MVHALADRDLAGARGLPGVVQVLVQEMPADPPRAGRELAVGQMADDPVKRVAGRGAGIQCSHMAGRYSDARTLFRSSDNSKRRAPDRVGPSVTAWVRSPGRTGSDRPGPD